MSGRIIFYSIRLLKNFEPCFAPAQQLQFRLYANPTVKREGKRHILRQEDEQMAWLHRKGADHGFAIVELRIRAGFRLQARTTDGYTTIHEGVTFDGFLRVTDPDNLHKAIEQGIGSAKGFGFGLLSLARR